MKNGKVITVLCGVVVGYAVGKLLFKHKNNFTNVISNADRRYVNMLKEFYFEDYRLAVKKYVKYISMGLSPQEAFDTIIAVMPVDLLTIGEIND